MALLVSGLACTAAQFSNGTRELDPRTTADAHRASDRIRRVGRRLHDVAPVKQKPARANTVAGVGKKGWEIRSGDDARIHRVMFLAEVRVVLRAGVVVRLTRFVADVCCGET